MPPPVLSYALSAIGAGWFLFGLHRYASRLLYLRYTPPVFSLESLLDRIQAQLSTKGKRWLFWWYRPPGLLTGAYVRLYGRIVSHQQRAISAPLSGRAGAVYVQTRRWRTATKTIAESVKMIPFSIELQDGTRLRVLAEGADIIAHPAIQTRRVCYDIHDHSGMLECWSDISETDCIPHTTTPQEREQLLLLGDDVIVLGYAAQVNDQEILWEQPLDNDNDQDYNHAHPVSSPSSTKSLRMFQVHRPWLRWYLISVKSEFQLVNEWSWKLRACMTMATGFVLSAVYARYK